jgi:archaeal flagellar protein FlaJ
MPFSLKNSFINTSNENKMSFRKTFSKVKKILFVNNGNKYGENYNNIKNNQFVSSRDNILQKLRQKSANNFNIPTDNKQTFQRGYLDKIIDKDLFEFINIKIFIPSLFLCLSFIVTITYLFFGFEIALSIGILFLMGIFFVLYFPKINRNKTNSEISKELPFALRHMVTELRSGKGLHDTILSIANSNYGALSYEFSRVIEEIKYGEKTEKALINMSKRVSSDGLNRTIQQIVGTLRTGGNLAFNLNIIAEDVSFDLQIKLKDYSQKLNAFIMIYTFLAILGPVILLIMLMAASTVMGDVIPSNVVLIIYVFFFPMIVIFMGLMIKRLEPSI